MILSILSAITNYNTTFHKISQILYTGTSGVDNKGGGGGGFKTGGEDSGGGETAVIQAQSFTLPGSTFAGTGGRGDGASVKVFNGGFGGGGYACEYSMV